MRILIVEDETELALNYQEILESFGFGVMGIAPSSTSCLDFCEKERPDLILMDVKIQGEMDGIALSKKIKSQWRVPIIFTTAYSDKKTLDRISEQSYEGYLLKPFSTDSLKSAIHLAKNNFEANSASEQVFKVRDKGFTQHLPFSEILYFKADGLYTQVITTNKTYLVREILKNVQAVVDEKIFLRIHKSYLVNKNFIDSYNFGEVKLGEKVLPMKRGFRKALEEILS
ncbi:LytR/AlgR family response regulator transcription factor [Algoriphagus namhaensis]